MRVIFFVLTILQLISDVVYMYVSNHPSKVSSYPGPILENKGHECDCFKKGKRNVEKGENI